MQHFVRHHEPWLAEQGVNVDVWRKSCAAISKGPGTARSSSSSAAAKPNAAALAGAASPAASGGGAAAGGHVASVGQTEDDAVGGRRTSGTRHADGGWRCRQSSVVCGLVFLLCGGLM